MCVASNSDTCVFATVLHSLLPKGGEGLRIVELMCRIACTVNHWWIREIFPSLLESTNDISHGMQPIEPLRYRPRPGAELYGCFAYIASGVKDDSWIDRSTYDRAATGYEHDRQTVSRIAKALFPLPIFPSSRWQP